MDGHTLLKWLLTAVTIHLMFICLQFGSKDAYCAIIAALYDSARGDNAMLWCWAPASLAFLGLQNTHNYGAFAAAFGLLALGIKPTN